MIRKIVDNITLRIRITLLVSILLFTFTGLLSTFSISSSIRHFNGIQMNREHISQTESIIQHNEEYEHEDIKNNISVDVRTEKARQGFNKEQLIALCVINFIGVFITYFAVGKAIKPLTILSNKIGKIDEKNLNQALPDVRTNDEVGRLTCSFNKMLLRLKKSFDVQKNFAANAAHEFKTPLAVIKSSIQVLNLDESPSIEDYKQSLKVCEETVDHLIELVNELLFISGSVIDEKQLVCLHNVIEESIEKHKASITDKNIVIEKNIQPIEQYTNEILFRCIVNNLISNAIKYNYDNGHISISLTRNLENVILSISDTGIGLHEKHLPYIFESFYRVDESRSKKTEGNGLGLQIVKIAVEKLNGTIEVSSSIGKGSNFKVTIPN